MLKKSIRYVGSLLLAGALTAPLALQAQDRDDRHDHDRDHDKDKVHRVYDHDRKDYHQWNSDEDRSYRDWYNDHYKGKKFREYSRLKRRDQDDYWKWRHEHGDHDRDQH
jgi:Ni/Co efflux regulator RcnB